MEELGIASWTDFLATPQGVLMNRLVYRRERARLEAALRQAATPGGKR